MSYKYISISRSRLSEEWLRNNNFNPDDDIDIAIFITYTVVTDSYAPYNFVGTTEEDFLCNSQAEFEQLVAENKLSKII